MPTHTPLEVFGQTVEFSHLAPFTICIESQRAQKQLVINIRFSNHCYSKGLKPDVFVDQGLPTIDADSQRPRVFCPHRYKYSKKLPEILKNFENQSVKVFQTKAERNWVYSLSIDSSDGSYYIFFEVKRSSFPHKKQQDLDLVIESAYPRKIAPECRKEPIKFGLLCSKIFMREEVKTRR